MKKKTIFPFDDTKITIQVWYSNGADPFICAVKGAVTVKLLLKIENYLRVNVLPVFKEETGDYLFEVVYFKKQKTEELTWNWELPEGYNLDMRLEQVAFKSGLTSTTPTLLKS